MKALKTKPAPQRRYLTISQLRERWGNCSKMTIERAIKLDPSFPDVYKIGTAGRTRMFAEDDVERYERASVVRVR
jgi:hypothetical protein